MFRFELIHRSQKSRARVGRIHTPHGIIETPNFVPVATNAAIKAVDSSMINPIGVQLMFCNTYHLLLHPGPEVVAQAGGLHKFMNRQGPIITDSGGFQVFSLAYGGVAEELKSKGTKKHSGSVLKITEEGVAFRSYRDGEKIVLTPESSVQAQKSLGADIIIPLDELPPYHMNAQALKRSLDRTHRWEKRSLDEHLKNPRGQAMYSVVHGGIDPVLRAQSCDYLSKLPFDGMAIGGSLGKNIPEMIQMLSMLMPRMPEERPIHLLGIGDLPSIEQAIPLGLDTFDSSYPTRSARHGVLLTFQEALKIERITYKTQFEPIDATCPCVACTQYTRAYMHHLFKAHEASAHILATVHNLTFMMRLFGRYRAAILRDEI